MAPVDTATNVPKSVARAQAKYGTAGTQWPGKDNEVAARKQAMQNFLKRAVNLRSLRNFH